MNPLQQKAYDAVSAAPAFGTWLTISAAFQNVCFQG